MRLSLKETSRQLADFFAGLGWNANCCNPAELPIRAHAHRRSRRSSARPKTLKD